MTFCCWSFLGIPIVRGELTIIRNFSLPVDFPSIFWASAISLSLVFTFSHSFHMTSPFQPTPHQFLLKTFFHSNLHSLSIHSSLTNSILLKRLFSQTWTCPCCLDYVSVIVSCAFMYTGVTQSRAYFIWVYVICVYLSSPLRLSSKRLSLL